VREGDAIRGKGPQDLCYAVAVRCVFGGVKAGFALANEYSRDTGKYVGAGPVRTVEYWAKNGWDTVGGDR
jgi:hypothetical protein